MPNDNSNDHSKIESLAQYVQRILHEKDLKHNDVEERSRHNGDEGIAHAYIGQIVKGIAMNPSISKLKALAVGLDEPEDDLFNVARGLPLDYKSTGSRDPWPGALLAKAIGKIVSSPELTRIVKALMQMSLKQLQDVLKYVEASKSKSKD
jgi:transcriptional regulator with XRE-family HTH domain